MAKPLLVANWKNHPASLTEAKTLLKELGRGSKLYRKLSLFIAPPAPYLETVALRAKNFAKLASQGFSPALFGAQTGLITPEIFKSFGVRLAIIGHSEERRRGETSEMVAEKARAALRAGIVPLVCVGEEKRDADGEHFEFLREEIKASLAGLSPKAAAEVILAYEPAWAIGKGADDALAPSELVQSVIFIKKALTDLYGRKVAEKISILYGGSVEPENAYALMEATGVKGLLVGHASLKASSLAAIAFSLANK
jgi:triosephosphate isomerase (TIM)